MDVNYVVTMFPRIPAEGPSLTALYREQYANEKAAGRRKRTKKTGPNTNFARLDAEREINLVRVLAQS